MTTEYQGQCQLLISTFRAYFDNDPDLFVDLVQSSSYDIREMYALAISAYGQLIRYIHNYDDDAISAYLQEAGLQLAAMEDS